MEKLSFAVVGLNFGRVVARRMHEGNDFFAMKAICEMDRERADEYGRGFGVDVHYSLDALLERDDIDVVGLYSNPNGRAGLIRQCLQAGKDVVTTKPFERYASEARAILHEARELGRHVLVDSPSPVTSPLVRQLRTWVDEHQLGRPIGARVDVWRYTPEAAQPGRWLDDRERCPAAPVYRIGIYLINDLVQVFPDPKEVQVLTSRILTERATPDNAQVNVRFEGGALANIFTSFCVGPRQRRSMILNYEHGTIYRDIEPERAGAAGSRRGTTLSLTARGDADDVVYESAQVGRGRGPGQWQIFHDIIRGERQRETTDREIVNAIRIVEAMGRAEASGRTEPVPD